MRTIFLLASSLPILIPRQIYAYRIVTAECIPFIPCVYVFQPHIKNSFTGAAQSLQLCFMAMYDPINGVCIPSINSL